MGKRGISGLDERGRKGKKMKKARKHLYENEKYSFCGAILFGIIAHGFIYTNKISFHDDIGQLFGLGQTLGLGRWFLGLIGNFLQKSIGIYSMPWLWGIMSLFLLPYQHVLLRICWE